MLYYYGSTVPSTRQHPGYGLEVKKEYYQNCSVLDCVTQCSQSAAHYHNYVSSSYRSNRLVLWHWDLMLCVEMVASSCIIVTWWSGSGEIHAWSWRPTGLLQCFDTVGLVIWSVKIIPEMTCNVSSETLSLYTTMNLCSPIRCNIHMSFCVSCVGSVRSCGHVTFLDCCISGPFPCKAIKNIVWKGTKTWVLGCSVLQGWV